MCDCINQIQKEREKILEYVQQRKPKAKIVGVELHPVALMLGGKGAKTQTYSTLEVKIDIQKKPIEIRFSYSYCPFCGKKY